MLGFQAHISATSRRVVRLNRKATRKFQNDKWPSKEQLCKEVSTKNCFSPGGKVSPIVFQNVFLEESSTCEPSMHPYSLCTRDGR